jgi:DNA polymerase-3 subunit gamma/tau
VEISNKLPVTNTPTGTSAVPNPQPHTPTNPQISKLRSTTAIGKPIAQQEASKTTVAQEPVNHINKPFTTDELKIVWDRLIEDLQNRKKFSEYVILNREFTLDGTTIHIEVDNEIQVDLLTISLRTEVLTYLRKELQNYTIHLEVVVSKEETKTMIYTQADKFKFMADKNPALHDLRSILGLDYDY